MSLAESIATLAPESLQIHIWPNRGRGFQINVSEKGAHGWTVVFDDDPVEGLAFALRQRLAASPDRQVFVNPRQASEDHAAKYAAAPKCEPLPLEVAIAAAADVADAGDYGDLLG